MTPRTAGGRRAERHPDAGATGCRGSGAGGGWQRGPGRFWLVSHVEEFGGAEKVLLRLGSALRKKGLWVRFAVPAGALHDRIAASGHAILRLPPLARKENPSRLRHWRRVLAANELLAADTKAWAGESCLVFNGTRTLTYLWFLAGRPGGRGRVCLLHDLLPNAPFNRLVVRAAAWSGVRFLCVSEALVRGLGAQGRRVSVLPNPAWGSDFVGGRDPDRHVRIGTVAWITEGKGHLLLLDGVARVAGKDPDISYSLYGACHGGEVEYYRRVMKRLETIGCARFEGFATDPTRAMARLDIFLQGSLRSEQPLSLGEAIAAGCAVVIPTGGGEEEVTRGWPATFTYRRGDVTSLCRAIEEAVRSHRARGVPLGTEDFHRWRGARDPDEWLQSFLGHVGV